MWCLTAGAATNYSDEVQETTTTATTTKKTVQVAE